MSVEMIVEKVRSGSWVDADIIYRGVKIDVRVRQDEDGSGFIRFRSPATCKVEPQGEIPAPSPLVGWKCRYVIERIIAEAEVKRSEITPSFIKRVLDWIAEHYLREEEVEVTIYFYP